jgi:hypothetical protein
MMAGSAAITVINNNNRILNSGAPPEKLSIYFSIELAIIMGYIIFTMARDRN